MGEQITKIADEKREAKIFALIAYETQDMIRLQQVVVVHEPFVRFYDSEKADGESLANLLKNVLTSLSLDERNMQAQCYEEHRTCESHTKELPQEFTKKTLFLCTFIQTSCHISKYLQTLKSFQWCTLKSLCDTRWSCCVEAVHSLLDNFESTLTALSEIAATDHTCSGEASALLNCMEKLNFLFHLLFLRRVLSQSDILSKVLQSGNESYETVKCVANSTMNILLSFRTDAFFTQLFNHCTEVAEDYGFQPAQLPRIGRIPQNIWWNFIKLQYFSLFLTFLCKKYEIGWNLDVLNHLSTLLSKNKVDSSSVDVVCDYYNVDKECLMAELECFYKTESIKYKCIEERVVA
ncbi:hypothetical protein PR048_002201, partial [Dryococelus australis]